MFDAYYGFTGKPFQLTPDPEFYFRSITHRKALSYLGYGLAQGEGFIVITGEVGAGKSTLVAHMMESLDESQVTVAQIVTSKLDGEEIVHVVARSFGLDIEGHDKATALTEIESFLHEEAREGRRCLLVVDESQNLTVSALEELRMLSNFQLGSHPLLQTLLLGQPEFRGILQDSQLEQLRQRVIAAHHLEPMQPREIEPYIMHRLKKVGWDGRPTFDDDVYAELHEASGGIPRRVNQIVNRLLLLGTVEERDYLDKAMLQNVLGEMHAERATSDVAPSEDISDMEPAQAAEPTVAVATGGEAPQIDKAMLEAYLAERDAQIAELQQAVFEMAEQRDAAIAAAVNPEIESLREQLVQLEAKCFEQECTIRQTLTMLIDWFENEFGASKAA